MKDIKSMTLAELGDRAESARRACLPRQTDLSLDAPRRARFFGDDGYLPQPARAARGGVYPRFADGRAAAAVAEGRNHQIPLAPNGRKLRESVLMRYHYGNTICISSEVGCRMGCAFCASTRGGLVRRLEPSEMLDQVLFSQLDSGLPISQYRAHGHRRAAG